MTEQQIPEKIYSPATAYVDVGYKGRVFVKHFSIEIDVERESETDENSLHVKVDNCRLNDLTHVNEESDQVFYRAGKEVNGITLGENQNAEFVTYGAKCEVVRQAIGLLNPEYVDLTQLTFEQAYTLASTVMASKALFMQGQAFRTAVVSPEVKEQAVFRIANEVTVMDVDCLSDSDSYLVCILLAEVKTKYDEILEERHQNDTH